MSSTHKPRVTSVNLMAHVRIVGFMSERNKTSDKLTAAGWRIERGGPLPVGGLKYDTNRFEIIAVRKISEGERVHASDIEEVLSGGVGDGA